MTTLAMDMQASSLEQALTLAQTLENMLEQEFEHLKVQNLDAFEASQASKNELLQQLAQLADGQKDSQKAIEQYKTAFQARLKKA